MNDLNTARSIILAIVLGSIFWFLVGLTALSVHAVYEAVQPVDKPCMRDEHGRKRDCTTDAPGDPSDPHAEK